MLFSVPDQIHAAKATAKSAGIPELLKKVEANYSKSVTLRTEFSQVNESAATKRKETSSGTIVFKRPKKFRWEVQKPEHLRSLTVSDGKTIWAYTPPFDETEPGQLITRKAAQFQSPLAQTLLAGSFSQAKGIKVEAVGPATFNLTPKKGTAGTVVRALLEVEPTKLVIQKVVLEHADGNRSEISLSKVELGVDVNETLFQFTAPPNTDIVK